jgi:hypothetical protein
MNWIPYTPYGAKISFQKSAIKENLFQDPVSKRMVSLGNRRDDTDVYQDTPSDWLFRQEYSGVLTNKTYEVNQVDSSTSFSKYRSYSYFNTCYDSDLSVFSAKVLKTFTNYNYYQSCRYYSILYWDDKGSTNSNTLELLQTDRVLDIDLANFAWQLLLINYETKSIA